ncbi:helicase-related protein, partial [Mycolicibacterium gadium]
NEQAAQRESTIRTGFNSPFRPFVLASTSVGQEGLDFHTYSHAIVHWNLPNNPVDLEQREGRVHRYKGHAVRKNVADVYGAAALWSQTADPWRAMFEAAVHAREADDSDIKPFWIFTRPGGAVIERYVPALPLSREAQQYR